MKIPMLSFLEGNRVRRKEIEGELGKDKRAVRHYSPAFKESALTLASEIGIKKATAQLGLGATTLYGWSEEKLTKSNFVYV